jgi:hypothetical protein
MFTAMLSVALVFFLAAEAAEEGASLFDGKTFAGWEGNLDWFRIEDGAIVAGTLEKPIPQNEFLTTKESYGDFELRLKVKLLGELVPAGAVTMDINDDGLEEEVPFYRRIDTNAGVQIRSQRIPNHHEMVGYQADLGQQYWGCLYDESRRNKVLAGPDQETIDRLVVKDDWNEYVIRCEGPRIQLWLNGEQTVDYTEPDPEIPQTGLIGLQIHSGPPAEAWYKDIVLKPISH